MTQHLAPRPPYNTASGRPYPTPLYVIHTLSNNSEEGLNVH